jgi:saccharopine dehydrogenase-like protein
VTTPARIVVLGGYGTFGARVSRALAARGHRIVVAGRDLDRARTLARSLGPDHGAAEADATDVGSCRRAIRGAAVSAVCAGPFSTLGTTAAEAALAEGAHHVDIADDRGYVRRLRALDGAFAGAGRTAVFGASSLPAVSSALALSLAEGRPRPVAARVALFIGAANPKGEASVRALVDRLHRTDGVPGFGDPRAVGFPEPFGTRDAYTFDAPEHDLFPDLLGVASVDVRVAFELPGANRLFALLARARGGWGRHSATVLARLAALVPRVGATGGAVRVELEWPDGTCRARALLAAEEAQRIAALPCVAVAHALAAGSGCPGGVRSPTDVVAPAAMLDELVAGGLRLVEA